MELHDYLIHMPIASIIFAITVATSFMAFSNPKLLDNLILHPYTVARKKRAYTVITSGLIHGDVMHLAFNMFSYSCFAFYLEKSMGHWQFGILYIANLILSDLPTIYKHRDDYQYSCLGASGAVSAVIFGYILYNPTDSFGVFPIPFIGIPAIIFGPLYLVYCQFASRYRRDHVNHDAHFYGALSGLMITIILNKDVLQTFADGIKSIKL